MRCSTYLSVIGERCFNYVKTRGNVTRFQTFYAGLIMCFVPLVIGDTERRQQLTYDSIYNNTKYAQIQQWRPYQTVNINYIRSNTQNIVNTNDDIRDANAIDYEELEYSNRYVNNDVNSAELLVGFSYDPYRFSVPEAEFVKGFRSYEQQSDMKTDRGKRGVGHLYNMIYCATGCQPLSYKGYGCYCGFLGEGRPTDPIDRCCQMHDKCYENLFCPFFTVYFQPYYWKCYRGEPLCALENHSTRNQLINGCAGRLCECDRQLAMCLRRYRCPRGRARCRSSPLRLLQNILLDK